MGGIIKEPLFVRVAYEWGNPYREPPDGQSRVLAEVFYPYAEHPKKSFPEIEKVWRPGSGYMKTYTFISEPPKQMSQQTLASIRQKRLRRRIEKKYPLLADQIVAEEMGKNFEYYQGVTREDLRIAHETIIRQEQERIEEIRRKLS